MATILLPYGTTEGHTTTIAGAVADVLRARGHEVDTVDVRHLPSPLRDGYDAVIVGASVHLGQHDRSVVDFVRANLDMLGRVPSAFFSVSLAAHGDLEEAQGYLTRFQDDTGWHPDSTALFAGALVYTRYGFLKRRLMRKIARSKPGELGVDTSQDYVYTDWEAVRRFAGDCADRIEQGPA